MALTALEIKNAKEGIYPDGNGLYLHVSNTGAKSWKFRFQLNGKRRSMGLGALSSVSAIEAREEIPRLKRLVKDGIDPIEQRKADTAKSNAPAAKVNTFMDVALDYIAQNRAGWKNTKHAQQWENTLETYAKPVFKDTPIDQIDTDLVLRVLNPIWTSKNETASRVRSRIELVLSYARAKKLRSGENPAIWRGNLDAILPKPNKVQKVRHHPALPFDQISKFMTELRTREGISPRALELAILTATRSNEVRFAAWSEFNLDNALWIIPGVRMKGDREDLPHRVPLSQAAIDMLKSLPRFEGNDLLFPGPKSGKAMSDMTLLSVVKRINEDRKANGLPAWIDPKSGSEIVPHGFRSTFRDWAAEMTDYQNEMVEMALAHVVGNKAEAAYRRGDMFQRRLEMMETWARYCTGSNASVVSIHEGKGKAA